MRNDAVYWIWLSQGLGLASMAARTVLERGLDARELYQMDLTALQQLELLRPDLCRSLKKRTLTAACNIWEECERKGYSVITPMSRNYPRSFYALQDPPLVLYVQGDPSLLGKLHNLPVLTVVGTRSATAYGTRVAENMSFDLACAGFIIVSGLAVGIDSCAHNGALRAGKKTIAVLAAGLNVSYPSKNAGLRKRIVEEGGLVLTELEPSATVRSGYFSVRNRLLAGLSQGVLVVEAPQRSGALLTANHALEQGKEVFAVPSDIYDPNAVGTLSLIRDGATPAITALDVAYPYFAHFADHIQTSVLLQTQDTAGFLKPKPLQKRRPAVWEKNAGPQHFDEEKTVLPKSGTGQPPKKSGQDLHDTRTDVQKNRHFTRELPGLGEEWKREKARILEEINQNTRGKEKEELKREQGASMKGPFKIQAKEEQPAQPQKQAPSQHLPQQCDTHGLAKEIQPPLLNEQQQKVYAVLSDKPQSLSEIASRCQMSVAEVTALLFEIGVPDPVRMYPGMLFSTGEKR